jgi:predicted ATPase/DNA-binding SARP family transcriptional activator
VTIRLRLLDGVAMDGTAIPGERPAALLAALALHPAGLSDTRLVDLVWGDEPPAHPTKALQVLVSRLRSVDRDLVARREGGYHLGLGRHAVDSWALTDLVARAEQLLRSDQPADAARLAAEATATAVTDAPDGPLADLRSATTRTIDSARRVHAVALARSGHADIALPLLADLHDQAPDDATLLAELLRTEARAVGTTPALARYDAYRRDLADRLGRDPDPALRRIHRELLAADSPVHTGVRYDPDELLGRADDLARLRAALASGRLTTVLGPGGIGKTRIAHVLAREATQPRVHVVELVGVGSGDDVVAEVGAALGIRGSVTTRHTLTPAQAADVRGRIARELDTGPALLVLDNCEHVLESVAGLVAYLLVTTRDLSVLATSRAPLRIAAERVVPLTQLSTGHAADLFARRARAARPDATLDPEAVDAVVSRLDGLPLAVELAAARVRTMSVEQIRGALDDRFGLLRSRDRTTPERHRTLAAVIEWSWGLLSPREREAAARLSVFHDGFDAATATTVLGPDGMDLIEALVDQSVVTVSESGGATRFRMLETIREYAAQQLLDSGHHDDAVAAQDRWAVELVEAHGSIFFSPNQIASIDALLAEEGNLTDVLRRALATGRAAVGVGLLSTLGSLWTITGNHPRIFAVADAASELLADWDPSGQRETDAAFEAAALLLVHLSWIPGRDTEAISAAMSRWGQPTHPWARATQMMFVADDEQDPGTRIAALADAETDPYNQAMLLMWAALSAENRGDIEAAASYSRRALDSGGLTPYIEASLHSELSQLASYRGDHHLAAHHAELAWPMMMRLHAVDDANSLRFTSAASLILDRDVDGAERILDEIGDLPEGGQLGSRMLLIAARSELALARGDVEAGLAGFDRAVDEVLVDLPGWAGGVTPWVLIAASGALTAHVLHAPPGPDPRADELRSLLLEGAGGGLVGVPTDDLPLSGVLMVAVGAWGLRHGDPLRHENALRTMAVGHRWRYNRGMPSLTWEPLAALAERVAPGRLAALVDEYADRPARDLLDEARGLLASLSPSPPAARG